MFCSLRFSSLPLRFALSLCFSSSTRPQAPFSSSSAAAASGWNHRCTDDDALPISTPTASSVITSSSSANPKKDIHSDSSRVLGRGGYKFWALAAILLLAFWSMLTGTVTLRWSAGNLNQLSDDLDPPVREDVDVLDMEEREKLVKHMWEVYTNSRRIRLPSFWQEAFVAAYEDLTSEVPRVRESAISEIAGMSTRCLGIDLPPLHSSSSLSIQELSLQDTDHRAMRSGGSNR